MTNFAKTLRWITPGALLLSLVIFCAAAPPSYIQSPDAVNPAAAEPTDAPHPATQPAAPGEGAAPGGLMDRAVDSGSQIYVDDSFSSVEKLHAAMRLDAQKQSQLAIQRYQEIIDEFGQKLVYLNNDFYVSLTDYVRQRLLAMPGVQKGDYDQLYGPQATKAISAAMAAGDVSGLIQACDRYFPSSAAVDGLAQAAEWYFERAEFASAARTWESLLAHPRVGTKQALFLHHAALAEQLGGRSAMAAELRDRLAKDFPDATGSIDGQETNLLTHLDGLLKLPQWEHAALPADEWPTFQGSPSRIALSDATALAGARLWSQSIDNPFSGLGGSGDPNLIILRQRGIINLNGRIIVNANRQSDSGPALSSYPVMSHGTLFVHAGDHVMALNLTAGTSVWNYPAQPKGSPDNPNGNDTTITNIRPPSHDSCTLFGDQVFAILPTPDNRASARIYYGVPSQAPTRLAALNQATGQEYWSVSAASLPINVRGNLAFVGSPLVTRQGVFVLVRKLGGDAFTQLYLARLDRLSGAINWTCYLCSASTGGMYNFSGPLTVPLLAMADDVAYVSTGQGADCAVDANAGRILWLQVTESARTNPALVGNYGRPLDTVPSWKMNPPLVYKDRLITSENGAAIRLYDRWTGTLAGRINPRDIDNATVVAGIVEDHLVTVGQKIHAIDLATGQDAWEPIMLPSSALAGALAGRPFLTEKILYVPMEKGLALVDMQKGGVPTFNQWPKSIGADNKETVGRPGNLLVTNEQIVVVSDTEVSAYSRWETARDKRLLAIEQNPHDPRPYLDLAEVAFRTAHYDLAQSDMHQAVDLALSPQLSNDPVLLTHLYQINLSFAEQLMRRDEKDIRTQARFYFDQSRLTARTAETNAEWRLVMAPFSLDQERFDEAADLYSQILADSAMRNAMYHHDQTTSHAGIAAESRFSALIDSQGRAELGLKDASDAGSPKAQIQAAGRRRVYQRFEDQATALLSRARAQPDAAALRNVIDSYPNSLAALSAAGDLSKYYQDKADPLHQIEVLRWSYFHSVKPEDRAKAAADLALAHIALQRYSLAWSWTQRGQSHLPGLTWTESGKSQSFSQLRDTLRALAPDTLEPHRAAFNIPANPPQVVNLATGTLLTPLEGDPFKHRPDLIAGYIPLQGRLTLIEAATRKTKSTCILPDRSNALLLGFVHNRAILATSANALAVDVDTGAIAWRISFPVAQMDAQQARLEAARIRQMQVQQRLQLVNPQGGAIIIDNVGGQIMIANDQTMFDSEQSRANQFATVLTRPGFQNMRILGNHLVALCGREVRSFDLDTGKASWFPVSLPGDTTANILVGNDDFLVTQMDSQAGGTDRLNTTFVVVDAATGRNPRTLKLDGEHVFWRALGDDGTLYTVSESAVAAYDLRPDAPAARWRRDDIHTRYPAASALTLDGLVIVDSNNELNCLAQESGDSRWDRSNRIDVSVPANGAPYLFARVDGDNVNIQSANHIAAYRTLDGEKAWGDSLSSDDQSRPMFLPGQIGERYLVILASGPTAKNPQAAALYIFNRVNPATGELTNGKLETPIPLMSRSDDPRAPNIRNWQIVNGGIVFDLDGSLKLLAGKPSP